MKLQVLVDNSGNETGVFIPIQDWENIKRDYPEIEESTTDLPEWQKKLIDDRLQRIKDKPDAIIDGATFFERLGSKK
jgi:hypothetical protein